MYICLMSFVYIISNITPLPPPHTHTHTHTHLESMYIIFEVIIYIHEDNIIIYWHENLC